MNQTYEENRQELTEWVRKVEYMKYTLNSLLYWDKITHMPPGGIEYRSEVMGFFGDELYKLMGNPRLVELMSYFDGNERNDHTTNATIRKLSRSAMYVSRIPQAEYTDYIRLVANAEQVWETARCENNFLLIQPYLERLLAHYRNFAEYWGYESNPYDAWLGYYEEGFNSGQLDELIAVMKSGILSLLEKIRAAEEKEPSGKQMAEESGQGRGQGSGQGRGNGKGGLEELPGLSRELQMELTKKLLGATGFSFQNGRVDEGAHPTILSNSPMDVRLVTTFQERNLKPCIFNAMYLAGKGLYEQEIDRALLGTMVAEVASFALEEAVGRLYENGIGRSRKFWSYLTPILKESIPGSGEWDSELLFREANRVNLTPVRLEADELTYMIHIIIRCELERELMEGSLSVEKLPEAWNSKYREYLSIQPEDNSKGVLQDIHWVAGYFGYFASYLLSGLMSAQFAHSIERDAADFEGADFEGAGAEEQLSLFHSWLTEKVFRFGGLYPSSELVERACGEPLRADYYVDYLRKRFSEAYQLNYEGEE